MKTWTFQRCGFLLALAMLPLAGGCNPQEANSALVPDSVTNQQPMEAAGDETNSFAPEVAEDKLAEASGTIISTPNTATNVSDNPQLSEIVKLVQAGVGE